ncbi:LIM domain-containing protein PLIM2a [Dionaea muscipula]
MNHSCLLLFPLQFLVSGDLNSLSGSAERGYTYILLPFFLLKDKYITLKLYIYIYIYISIKEEEGRIYIYIYIGKMVFSGTLDKCKACGKTVYVVDMVTADGVSYHKTCFKCSHCNGTLVMGRYSSLDGILYCMPHFDQLFKETGNFTKNFQTSTKSDKPNEQAKTPSKLSTMFSGTQDKCATCKKTAYPLEKLVVEGENYHKSCFRCAKGGCFLTASNYAALDGVLYCKPHFAQLFKVKGSYSHLSKSISIKKNESPLLTQEEAAPDQEQEHAVQEQ